MIAVYFRFFAVKLYAFCALSVKLCAFSVDFISSDVSVEDGKEWPIFALLRGHSI
jgi:hypothetical protein